MKKANLKTCRRFFQIFIALAFIIIPLANRSRYSMVYGNFLSFHMFGIPVADPLAVLQLTIKNVYFTLDNFIGTLLPLLFAFALGTVFCSWICPYGLLSELTWKLSEKVLPKSYKRLPLFKNGFPFKMMLFVAGFLGFLMFSTTPVLNQLSTAAWYARFFQYYFGQDFISLCYLFLLTLLLIEFLAGKRLWCRYICPQSILIILTKLISHKRLKVIFAEEKCICKPGYDQCDAACTLTLQPKTFTHSLETECNNCGDCVVACKKMGKALAFDFPALNVEKMARIKAAFFPRPRIGIKRFSLTVALAGIGLLAFIAFQQIDFSNKNAAIDHKLLSNKRIAFNSDKIGNIQLLSSGVIVASGGEWPVNGSKNWRWQPVDENGSFKVIPEVAQPESYTIIRVNEAMGKGVTAVFEHTGAGISEDFPGGEYQITDLADIQNINEKAASSVEGSVVLYHYANQTFVLNLEVRDRGGIIKKIETEGTHIGMEVMLTNVKKWINSPQIIVAEGEVPVLPFTTSMNVIFHDGHTESMRFKTDAIVDRGSEEFDDPWF